MNNQPQWDQHYPALDNTQADLRLLGVPNIFTPFGHFNSASRVAMVGHHLSQTMVLDNPEFNRTFTGVEHEMIDYTFNMSKRKHDCEILAVIPKYTSRMVHIDQCPEIYVIVATVEPNNQRRLDYFTVNRYFKGSQSFGFIPQLVGNRYIRVGEYLPKEAIITKSPTQVDDDQWAPGTNLNVAYGSFPDTIEDAFTISESAAKKLQTRQISQKILNFRQDRRPLNLNGNEYIDKFLPDIGELIRPDGMLCGSRPVHWTTVLADTDPEALREPLPLQDDIIYVDEPGARIVDLTFHVNRSRMNDCYDQAQRYMIDNLKCWESIYYTYIQNKDKYPLTNKMSTLVTDSIYRIIAQGGKIVELDRDNHFKKALKKFDLIGGNNQAVDFLQAVVTYSAPRLVVEGSKISDLHGGE
jgi:hypothetical protein